MNGKELLLQALQNKETPRPAWVPFVGVHGGKITGVAAGDYLKSADAILAGLRKARDLYTPDGLPVAFDLQLEAEALGCELHWGKDNPPSVTSHPLANGGDLADLPEFSVENGRFPIMLEATRRAKAEMGKDVALYGLLTGPFTLGLHLLGNDIFMEMMIDDERVQAIMSYCADIAVEVAEAYLEAGADVIAVVDPMTSQISPEHFEEFVTPHVNRIFDRVRELGGYSSMFVCGDATRVLENMCKTTCDNVSIDENISLEDLRDLAAKHDRSFGGNLKLTVVLLLGGPEDAKRDALRCLDAGRVAGSSIEAPKYKGFVLAPGCDLPYDVPKENIQAVAALVGDPYQQEIARSLGEATADDFADIELPKYEAGDKLYIDVVTLDSTACAPCQYMLEAANKAVEAIVAKLKNGENSGAKKPIVIAEHKVKNRQGIGVMCRLGVQHIPTICINGETVYSSIIPDQPQLIEAIERRM